MPFTMAQIKQAMLTISEAVKQEKSLLEAIDRQAGDGDLGISMEKGAAAIEEQVNAYGGENVGELFLKCAMALNRAAPSTMGTLLTFGLMSAGKEFQKRDSLTEEEVVKLPGIFAAAIMGKGGAKAGDRTILDALIPYDEALNQAFQSGASLSEAALLAASAAEKGAEATKGMVPKIGRAKWAPDNAKGVCDGGAVLCKIIAEAACRR